jgi:multidrug resistance efflux pump
MTIQEHQETLARERDAYAAALARESEAETALAALRAALGPAQAAAHQACTERRRAKQRLDRAEHLAAGKCSEMMVDRQSSGYNVTHYPCDKKAKEEDLCGIHLAVKRRRGR